MQKQVAVVLEEGELTVPTSSQWGINPERNRKSEKPKSRKMVERVNSFTRMFDSFLSWDAHVSSGCKCALVFASDNNTFFGLHPCVTSPQ